MARADVSTLADYVAIISRRRLIVALALVLVPAAAFAVSLRQSEVFEAEAQVLLSRQSLANTLQGTTDPTVFQDAERVVQTQAEIASTPEIAQRALREVPRADLDESELLAASDVEPEPNVDLLRFTVRDGDADLASALATAYAEAFTRYRVESATEPLVRARQEVRDRIVELQGDGLTATSPVLQSLLDKEQQLLTLETLQTGNATLVRRAGTAEQVQPRPVRNAVLGVVLGLGLGLLLAFVAEALDTRVRTSEELSELLGLPLLGLLPAPARALQLARLPAMLADPGGADSEAFRMLRTNVDFANLDVRAKTIMVMSGFEEEGKSTTVANLAVAYAFAGRRVVLIDADLRRPTIRRFFAIESSTGLTDVVLGEVRLAEALAPVQLPAGHARMGGPEGRRGSLLVLPAGVARPNAGEFASSRGLRDVITELRKRADLVLVDAPPVLQVGDAMTLSAAVDALLVVTRLKRLRRPAIAELRRLLDSSPATKLGFAVTDAPAREGYTYNRYEPRPRRRWGDLLLGRTEPEQAPSRPRERRTRAGSEAL